MIWDSSLVKCEISLQYKYTKKKMIKKNMSDRYFGEVTITNKVFNQTKQKC